MHTSQHIYAQCRRIPKSSTGLHTLRKRSIDRSSTFEIACKNTSAEGHDLRKQASPCRICTPTLHLDRQASQKIPQHDSSSTVCYKSLRQHSTQTNEREKEMPYLDFSTRSTPTRYTDRRVKDAQSNTNIFRQNAEHTHHVELPCMLSVLHTNKQMCQWMPHHLFAEDFI